MRDRGPFAHTYVLSALAGVLLVWTGLGTVALAQPFAREVAPFPVLGEDGVPYDHPFLGGLNTPRPQLADLDGDGDLDLFVLEHPGELIFFENTGTPHSFRFAWRTDRFAGLELGAWAKLGDLDGDGDHDVLAVESVGYADFYRNTGTPEAPQLELVAEALVDTSGTPLFVDPQGVPALSDIDCDGDLDLFSASVSGHLTLYEHLGLDEHGIPRFAFVSDRYQDIEIIGDFGGKRSGTEGTLHGANAITFSDIDQDGDDDLFWGDFFSPSLYFIENTGSCAAPQLERVADTFPLGDPLMTSGYNVPAFGDLDDDGDLDLLVGVLGGAFGGDQSVHTLYFLEQLDGGSFLLRTRQFLSMIDVGTESTPAFGDLDDDGDLDLILGQSLDPEDGSPARLSLFENQGTQTSPGFARTRTDAAPLDRRFNAAPALGDLDDDGDLDLLVGGFDGSIAYLRNDGDPQTPVFSLVDSSFVNLGATTSQGSNSKPALGDLDDDGDLDLLVGEFSGTLNLYRNEGTRFDPQWILESETFAGVDVGTGSSPALIDLDDDGDLDLLVGSENDGIRLYRNAGTMQEPAFVPEDRLDLPGTMPVQSVPAPADIDGDGDVDLFAGSRRGGLFFYRNTAETTALEEKHGDQEQTEHLHIVPNPFHDVTSVRFHLDRPGRVRLTVYDILGRTRAVLLDDYVPVGTHEVSVPPLDLGPGTYPCVLRIDGNETRTAMMVKVE